MTSTEPQASPAFEEGPGDSTVRVRSEEAQRNFENAFEHAAIGMALVRRWLRVNPAHRPP